MCRTSVTFGGVAWWHYGVDACRCYVCNADTPGNTYNTSDIYFPSNSSRLIIDDGLAAINRAAVCGPSHPFSVQWGTR